MAVALGERKAVDGFVGDSLEPALKAWNAREPRKALAWLQEAPQIPRGLPLLWPVARETLCLAGAFSEVLSLCSSLRCGRAEVGWARKTLT